MPEVLKLISLILSMTSRSTRLRLLTGTCLLSVASIFEVAGISLVLPIVNLMTAQSLDGQSDLILQFSQITGITNVLDLAKLAVFGLVLMIVAKSAFTIFTNYWVTKQIVQGVTHFTSKLFLAYLRAPLAWHHDNTTAQIIRRLRASSDKVHNNSLMTIVMMAADLIFTVGVAAILVYTSLFAAALCLTVGVLGYFVVNRFLRGPTARISQQDHEMQMRENAIILEAIEGIQNVRVLARENFFLRRFIDFRRQREPFGYLLNTLNTAPRYLFEILTAASIFIVFLYLTATNDKPGDVVAVLALYGVAAMRLLPAVSRIVVQVNVLRSCIPATQELKREVERFGDWIANDGKVAAPLPEPRRRIAFNDSYVFQNVSFKYNASVPVLEQVSFDIRANSTVGIVGPSGSGKSTLVGLMLGFYKPDSGEILVDSAPLDPSLSPFERSIGWVPQKTHLIDSSIRRNVAFGLEDEDINDDRVIAVLKQAQLYNFVMTMPNGLDSEVGERGVRMSGGQQQRLALARALYPDPDILILDEATSSLDLATEAEITSVIRGLHGQKTILVIAHRLSTIRNCDTICFLSEGTVVAKGSFDQLRDSCPPFRSLVELGSLI